jgi:hypothetical protein
MPPVAVNTGVGSPSDHTTSYRSGRRSPDWLKFKKPGELLEIADPLEQKLFVCTSEQT